MANQPIPVDTALQMIESYISYMEEHDIDMAAQTHSVGFQFTELQKWMNDVAEYSDELRVCLGVYPSGPHEGRITTILWPYKNGNPATQPSGEGAITIEPYNEGNGTP